MFKNHMETSMDTSTTTATATTPKSKKFPAMFKKMMLSRLKNISKDATSAVKSSVQKKTSSKKKTTAAGAGPRQAVGGDDESRRPDTATLDDKPPLDDKLPLDDKPPLGDKPPLSGKRPTTVESGSEAARSPQTTAGKRPVVCQQFNSRTYRVKTKDRKSVLSLPEVSKLQQQRASKNKRSYLPVKVKSAAPAPPIRPRQRNVVAPSPPSDDRDPRENVAGPAEVGTVAKAAHEDDDGRRPEGYQPEKWIPTAVGSARRKRLVLCYLCGKEFGTASLPFHEPQCLKKWTQTNSRLPEHLQRTIPHKPDIQNLSVDDWNQLAWEATQSNLVPCDYCQRKFLANRLEAHTRVCVESKKKTVPVRQLPPPVKSTTDKPKKKPAPCYVCGRLFGTASIGIHEPQCLIKWIRENDSLAPHLRRPVPVKPEAITDDVTGKVNHQATREEYWKTYLSQLVPCDRCKRTFDPDRLEVHQKSCKGSIIYK